MYCVVINKFLNSTYIVRHIIYDISPEEDIASLFFCVCKITGKNMA